MDGDEDEVIEDFYGVYMLYCTNPKYLGRTYIGKTTDPNRRVNQHNKGSQFGGARRTSQKGPWDMVLIIHGFPNEIAALRFEWAWQHPHRSRRLNHICKSRTNKRTVKFCIKIVSEMLNIGPWDRLPLTVRWLKPEYQQDFPRSIPQHMSTVHGPLIAKRLKCDASAVPPDIQVVNKCKLCKLEVSPEFAITCLAQDCSLVTHTMCLAKYFLKNSDSFHIIPVNGECPKCKLKCLWGDLIRKKKGCNI